MKPFHTPRARRFTAAASAVAGVLGLVACRGIAGIDDFSYVPEETDAASDGPVVMQQDTGVVTVDASACNNGVKPTTVFSTTDTLYNMFLQGGMMFVEIYSGANNSTSVSACDPNNCVGITPYILADKALWTEDVTAKKIYWTDIGDTLTDGGPVKNGSINAIAWPGDAGPKTPVIGTLNYPNYLKETPDESSVFFTDDPNNDTTNEPGPATLGKCTLPTCTNPVQWGSGFFTTYNVVVGSSRVFFLAASDLAGSKKALFACSLTMPCDAPTPKKLVEGQTLDSEAYVESNDTIYITSADQNAILQIAPSGTISTFVANQTTPEAIGIDSGWVYWYGVTAAQGTAYTADLRRKKLDGTGAVETILCGLNSPAQIHFDAGYIYLVDSGSSGTKVERIPKPK